MATSNTIIVPMSWRYWLGFSCLTTYLVLLAEVLACIGYYAQRRQLWTPQPART